MRVLIIGAGAVGLVYGQAFVRAGHEVVFLIKEKHRKALEAGVTLLQHRRLRADRQEDFAGLQLLTGWEQVAASRWNQVLLAIPSTALRSLPLDTLRQAIGTATLVMLQPSGVDRDLLLQHFPRAQLVEGMINLISYYHPLPDQSPLPQAKPLTVAWYRPPAFMPMPLSGEVTALATTLALFRSGGFPARAVADVLAVSRLPNLLLMTFLAALEASGWSFARLRGDRDLLALLTRAQREVVAASPAAGRVPPVWLYRLGLSAAPLAVPLPLEAYLRAHFTKVRAQTDAYLRDFLQQCQGEALTELHARVFDAQTRTS